MSGLKLGEQPTDLVGVFGLLRHKADERTPSSMASRACSIWWFKMSRRSQADGMAHSIQPRFPPRCRRKGGFLPPTESLTGGKPLDGESLHEFSVGLALARNH